MLDMIGGVGVLRDCMERIGVGGGKIEWYNCMLEIGRNVKDTT